MAVDAAVRADAQPRLAWIDAARGLAVLGVVLFHVCLWHVLPHASQMWDPSARVWDRVNATLAGVRMPLLLAVSGLVVSARLVGEGRGRSWRAGAVSTLYLYLVWLLVYALFYSLVADPGLPHRIDGWADLATQLVLPDTTLWYLMALSIYAVVVRLSRRLPVAVVLVVLAGVSVLTRQLVDGDVQWAKIPELAVFFAAGVHAAGPLRRLAERATLPRLAAAAAVAAAITLLGRFAESGPAATILFMVRGLAFMVAMVILVSLVVRSRHVAAVLGALGRRTLPVYVLHPLLIAGVLVTARREPELFDRVLAEPALSLAYPLVVTGAVVAVALAFGLLLERRPTAWLVRAPARLRDVVAR